MAGKCTKQDLIAFFDCRSLACRRAFEDLEEKLAPVVSHQVCEFWLLDNPPSKRKGPRVPGRAVTFSALNREAMHVSLPAKRTLMKVEPRAEFNSCGESLTSATSYTGIPMRPLPEIPRMDAETKAAIL